MMPFPEMNVQMTRAHEEGNKQQVEYEAYSSVKIRETYSDEADERSDDGTFLSKADDVGVEFFVDQTMVVGCVPPDTVKR